jgi:hypothetical protein
MFCDAMKAKKGPVIGTQALAEMLIFKLLSTVAAGIKHFYFIECDGTIQDEPRQNCYIQNKFTASNSLLVLKIHAISRIEQYSFLDLNFAGPSNIDLPSLTKVKVNTLDRRLGHAT